jgi:PKD repeat protein
MEKIKKLKIVPLIIIQILVLSYFISYVSAIDDQQTIIGQVFFEDGTTVNPGVKVYITNNDTGFTRTTTTYSDGKYDTIINSANDDVIWVYVSYYGNTGGESLIVDYDNHPTLQRADITISGNYFPVSNFSYTPTEPTEGQTVQFNCLSVDAENNTDIDRLWDFGDGGTSNQKNPTHQYSQDGKYDVTLSVNDYYGSPDSLTKQITVQQSSSGNGGTPPVNQPPNAVIDIPSYGYVTQDILFDSTNSYDSDGTISLFNWSFGDGNYSNQPNPTHYYSKNGTYQVTLEVVDNQGESDSDSVLITIYNQDNTCNITVSEENKEFIEQRYDIELNESFFAEDFNCDSVYDSFIDPNNKIEMLTTILIEEDKIFLLSIDNNDMPDFFWNPKDDKIVVINYTKPVNSTTEIDYKQGQILYEIKISKNNWSYIEIQNIYPKYDFFIKNSKKQIINNDRIQAKNDKIFVFDNTSEIYKIFYNYSILQPSFSVKNNSKLNDSKPNICINYSENVTIINAELNGENISLSTFDNQTFVFKPVKSLKNGLYNLSITVEDADSNLLTSFLSFNIQSNISSSSKKHSNNESFSIHIILILIVIVITSVFVFLFFKKFWRKK